MLNIRCPKCGSTRVQLTSESSKHGCLWIILFGIYYIAWLMVRWTIGIMIFLMYDWWLYLIKSASHKGYVWQSKRWFSNRRRIFYCHDCGYNFRA